MQQSNSQTTRRSVLQYLVISGIICLLSAIFVGYRIYTSEEASLSEIHWDVSHGNTVDLVKWPATHDSSVYQIANPIVNLKISDEYEINDFQPQTISVSAYNQTNIDNITMTLTELSLQDGYAEVARLAALFDMDTTKVDDWYQASSEKDFADRLNLLNDPAISPQISIKAQPMGTDGRIMIILSINELPASEVQ